jgi:hypothetical protein
VSARLSELTASARRLALVGLAKNTGKTVALGALLRELEAEGRRVGVTSIGRDGEERDAIDSRIDKPSIELAGGSLVATTDSLLRASGIPHELLEQTDVRTPLGRVIVVRLRAGGAVEVAGPSAAQHVLWVSDAMLAHGAEQVLIDGAIDRRAASSPAISDALVISTGAVLDEDLSEVVKHTAEAVQLVRLPTARESPDALALAPRVALTAEAEPIARLLDAHPQAQQLIVTGALPDRFLHALAPAVQRRRRELTLLVEDPTKVFLLERGLAWYERHGVTIAVRRGIELAAITVNPVAPRAHRFDSAQLRSQLEAAIEGVSIFDVLDPAYGA